MDAAAKGFTGGLETDALFSLYLDPELVTDSCAGVAGASSGLVVSTEVTCWLSSTLLLTKSVSSLEAELGTGCEKGLGEGREAICVAGTDTAVGFHVNLDTLHSAEWRWCDLGWDSDNSDGIVFQVSSRVHIRRMIHLNFAYSPRSLDCAWTIPCLWCYAWSVQVPCLWCYAWSVKISKSLDCVLSLAIFGWSSWTTNFQQHLQNVPTAKLYVETWRKVWKVRSEYPAVLYSARLCMSYLGRRWYLRFVSVDNWSHHSYQDCHCKFVLWWGSSVIIQALTETWRSLV